MERKEAHELKIRQLKASLKDICSEKITNAIDLMTEDELVKYVYDEYYVKQHLSTMKIAKLFGFNNTWMNRWFNKNGLSLRSDQEKGKLYYCNENYFDVVDNEHKAYWLGFLCADGFIQNSSIKGCSRKVGLSLIDSDIKHLEKLKKDIETNAAINIYQCKGNSYNLNSKYCRIMITSEKLVSSLIDKGCVEHKSNIIKFPTEEQVPYLLLKHYIRGYFDGNGSVTIVKPNKDKNRNTTSYKIRFTSTDDMLNGIQNYLLNEGIIKRLYPLSKRKQEHIVSNFEFGGNLQSYKFLKWLYEDAEVYLDRKYERYLSLKEYIEQNYEEAA